MKQPLKAVLIFICIFVSYENYHEKFRTYTFNKLGALPTHEYFPEIQYLFFCCLNCNFHDFIHDFDILIKRLSKIIVTRFRSIFIGIVMAIMYA